MSRSRKASSMTGRKLSAAGGMRRYATLRMETADYATAIRSLKSVKSLYVPPAARKHVETALSEAMKALDQTEGEAGSLYETLWSYFQQEGEGDEMSKPRYLYADEFCVVMLTRSGDYLLGISQDGEQGVYRPSKDNLQCLRDAIGDALRIGRSSERK